MDLKGLSIAIAVTTEAIAGKGFPMTSFKECLTNFNWLWQVAVQESF